MTVGLVLLAGIATALQSCSHNHPKVATDAKAVAGEGALANEESKKTDETNDDPGPTAKTEYRLRWLDDNRLELGPGVFLNIHNGFTFGASSTIWDPLAISCSSTSEVLSCGSYKAPDDALVSPAGARAWMVHHAAERVLCVAQPPNGTCPQNIGGEMRCAALIPRPKRAPSAPPNDPLTVALGRTKQIFLNHRGLQPGDRGE